MSEFVVRQINKNSYNRLILCLTFESLFDYLTEIESSPLMVNSSGDVLIDQLFITGNNYNRFLSCHYENGKLDFTSARNIDPGMDIRKLSTDLLNENYACVENSILTEHERECVKEKIAF